MTSRRSLFARRAVSVAIAGALTTAVLATAFAPAANALDTGYQKVLERTLYESQGQPIAVSAAYDRNGQPVYADANCKNFPGVYRWSKAWFAVYGKIDTSLQTAAYGKVRMQFHTTYSPAVAAAKTSYMQVKQNASCATLNAYNGRGVPAAIQGVACAPGYPQRPVRFCDLAVNHPNDPALDMHLQEKCAALPGGPYPALWNEWHNTDGHLFTYKIVDKRILDITGYVIQAVAAYFGASAIGDALNKVIHMVPPSIEFKLDDVTVVGGVRNFNQQTASNTDGTWLGYGHAQSPALSEVWEKWYDSAARGIVQPGTGGKHWNPVLNPVQAHQAVDAAIAAGSKPQGTLDGSTWITRAQLTDAACGFSYGIRDLLDPSQLVTYAGIGQDVQNLTAAQTGGQNFCQRTRQTRPVLAANGACNNFWLGRTFTKIDTGGLLDASNSDVVKLFGGPNNSTDFGTGRVAHLNHLVRRYLELVG